MKSSKKALALALAAAMVVTAIPATNANAATTGLSAKKATVYVGGSKTLTVKTPKSWKSVKVTASTSNKKVAKVKKISNKKVKVTAVKAGTAKVKVKVTYKKSTKKNAKKYTKTYTCKTTVKTPTIKLNQTKVTLNVGDTTPVKVTKKTPSSITVKYSSEDPAIASVAKGTITAVSAGTTNIVVKAKYGTKTITKKVKVTVAAAKDGLTPVLTNQLSATDYPNTVLVSDPAIIKVTYAKDGKPVAGQTLVVSKNNDTQGTGMYGHYYFENTSATTNASGVATFVLKNTKTNIKASEVNEIASVNYRIQLADNSADTGTNAVNGTVNFASLSVKDIENLNNINKDADGKLIEKDDLVPGTNYQNVYGKSDKWSVWNRYYQTNTAQGVTDSEYVVSQQVSAAGTTEHAVTMQGGYPVITLPGTASNAVTTKGSQDVSYTSGDYKTYAEKTQEIKLEKDPKELSYATLNFKDVSISKYTTLTVNVYKTALDAKNKKNAVDTHTYTGEMTQASFGYQIPIDKLSGDGAWITVTLKSEGQVQDGKNNGYSTTTIDYVYKNPVGTAGKEEIYKNGKVTWKQVDSKYTADVAVTTIGGVNYAKLPDTEAGVDSYGFNFNKYNYTVKLPVFPYTGNAIITKSDKNGKVLAYYAAPTANEVDKDGYYKNVNVVDKRVWAYQISADEVKDTTGTVTTSADGKTVTMNAEKAGRMTLEGVVTINGKEYPEADLAHVYTSVQWNPVEKKADANKKYVALLGQKIEVVAQLVDKNGNAVSESNQAIDFFAGSEALTQDKVLSKADKKAEYGAATVTDVKGKTDTQGQAKVTLKASDITTLTNITAKAADKRYDVVLSIVKGDKVESADLYWADADIAFTDQVGGKTVTTDTVNTSVKTAGTQVDVNPEVGTSWFYGVKINGTFYDAAANTTAAIDIKGVDASVSKTATSVGTMQDLGGGTVKATSTKSGDMAIVSKINSSTGTANATVSKDGYAFAGTGAPNIDKKLELDVNWNTKGISASYIVPTGTRVVSGSTINVYVKVKDSYGNPMYSADPTKNTKVTFSVDGKANIIDPVKTVPVDKNGIATIQIKGTGAAGTTTTVTAKVNDDSFDQTFRWVANSDPVAINTAKNTETNEYVTRFDKDKKTVTLVFKDDIVTESVIKELFTSVTVGGTPYAVKSVATNGSVVTLTLADVPTTIKASDSVVVTIANRVMDSENVLHTLTSVNGMENGIHTIEFDANNNAGLLGGFNFDIDGVKSK